jgi:hypothetical protein
MNKNFSKTILDRLLIEVEDRTYNLKNYPMGAELEKAVLDKNHGIPYFEFLLASPGLSEKIINMKNDIIDFNDKHYKDNEEEVVNNSDLLKLKERRRKIIKEIRKKGFFINWDILDNIWDKLPGD